MKTANNKYQALPAGRLKRRQHGATLLEVLVSMILLSIGVLALLATQLRTVASVREAEGQTVVAQAVQNLIEGMLANPDLSNKGRAVANAGNSGSGAAGSNSGAENTEQAAAAGGWVFKDYSAYEGQVTAAAACTPNYNDNMTKAQLATAQLCQFRNSLHEGLGEASVQYIICRDTSSTPPEIDAQGKVDGKCTNGAGAPTVVKVIWQMDIENAGANAASSALNLNGTKAVYTYSARVTE